MSNIISFKLTEKKQRKLDIKHENDYIVHRMYREGKCKYNPYEIKGHSKSNILEIPQECFKKHKYYRVGA